MVRRRLFLITDFGPIELDRMFWHNLDWRNPRLLWIGDH